MATSHLKRLGRAIRLARLKQGMTQEQLSGIAQVNTAYISGLENGHHDPTVGTLRKLATALDIKTSDLVKEID